MKIDRTDLYIILWLLFCAIAGSYNAGQMSVLDGVFL